MANPTHYPPGGATAFGAQPPPGPPRNARGETPVETERRWLSNIAAVTFPVVLAGKLLKPKYLTGKPDPTMERVNRIRAWIGLTLVFGIFLGLFYTKKKKADSYRIPTSQGAPVPSGTSNVVADNLAAGPFPGPVPQVTGLPTNMPTKLPTNYPTDLSSLFPSGFPKVPTNIPTGGSTRVPTGTSTMDPGLQQTIDDANKGLDKLEKMNDGLTIGKEVVSSVVHHIVLAPILCALGIVVMGLVLTLTAHPSVRGVTARQLAHPVRVILVFCGVMAIGITCYVLLRNAAGLKHKTYLLNKDGTQKELILSWLAASLLAWCILFALGGLWQVTKHLFAAADGHPLLLPLLTMWLAWTMTLNDVTLQLGNNLLNGLAAGSDTVPDNMKNAVGILGATMITILSMWEISRLNKWNGISFRSGPFGRR